MIRATSALVYGFTSFGLAALGGRRSFATLWPSQRRLTQNSQNWRNVWSSFEAVRALISRWAGGLVTRTGPKLPLVVGPAIAGVGFLLFARPEIGGSYWVTFFPAIAVFGLGMSLTVAPLVTVVMGSVEQNRSGLASGINNAISRAASLLALAVFGMIALALFNGALDSRLADVDVPVGVIQIIESERVKLAAAEAPAGLEADVTAAVDRAVDLAYVGAFRGIMLISAALAFASALTALLWIEGSPVARPKLASVE